MPTGRQAGLARDRFVSRADLRERWSLVASGGETKREERRSRSISECQLEIARDRSGIISRSREIPQIAAHHALYIGSLPGSSEIAPVPVKVSRVDVRRTAARFKPVNSPRHIVSLKMRAESRQECDPYATRIARRFCNAPRRVAAASRRSMIALAYA